MYACFEAWDDRAKGVVGILNAKEFFALRASGAESWQSLIRPVVIRDSAGAATILRPLYHGLDREQFLVACLDAKHAIIGVNVVSIGSLTISIVHPREVFKPAILLNSAALICVHNHPSGDPQPSAEDRVLTARLRQAGDLIGITILDHIILGENRTFSFADQGWPA